MAGEVLTVDPETLARAAHWDDRYASRSLEAIADDLAAGGDELPVVVVGDLEEGALEIAGATISTRVVERADAFPGMSRRRPTVVASTDELLAAFDEAGVNSPLDASSSRTQIWSKGEDTAHALETSSAQPYPVVTAEEGRNRPERVAFTRTFAFLEALGIAAGLLAIVGLAVYIQVRQRGRVVAFGLARRMGLSLGSHRRALALELGIALAAAFALGLGAALLAARLVLTEVEPLASISPVPLLVAPVAFLAAMAVLLAVVVAVAATLANRSAARADVAEVLRLGG